MAMRRRGIVPVLGLLLVTMPAFAGDAGTRERQLEARREQLRQKWERQFREADSDGSRTLTREEAEAARLPRSLLERFDEIDTDGDGALSPEELLAARQKRVRAATKEGTGPSVP